MSRWFLGPPRWSDLERVLSGRPAPTHPVDPADPDDLAGAEDPADPDDPAGAEDLASPEDLAGAEDPAGAGGRDLPEGAGRPDEPDRPVPAAPAPAVPYAELHAHSHFSFLDGASSPEEMVEQAARLGLSAIALTDHDGFYGIVRFAAAARRHGIATVFGAELTLGREPGAQIATPALAAPSPPRTGVADPDGEHLGVLARNLDGYRSLSAAIARAHLDGRDKGEPRYRLADLAAAAQGDWLVLTGCRKGAVTAAARAGVEAGDLESAADAAAAALTRLVELFGAEHVAIELTPTGDPLQDEVFEVLAVAAKRVRIAQGLSADALPLVATTGAHYAHAGQRHLADVAAAIRSRRSLDDIDGHLASRRAQLRSGEEMARLLARHPEAVAAADRIGRECAFDLALVAPDLPPCPVPPGHDEGSWLRVLALRGARERYGPPEEESVPGAHAQIEHELEVITGLGFPGYFLIVHDLVQFCGEHGILCQGRGSAANSAVCYALGITAVDPVRHGLLFERFLAPERDGPPDIDLDIAADRREEVIQYVYTRYGRTRAAQVANVITYRARMAVRDAARALGYDVGQQDAWSKRVERSFSSLDDAGIPGDVLAVARSLRDAPRHLGIHSGGMVLCDRPVIEVCPVEHARMKDRTVLQWDKDDCAEIGLVKFDLLGLGMLTALDHAFRLIAGHHGEQWTLATLPQEDAAVYDMLCAADSVGVFQVESRAQMSTLPRLKPRRFYDLVVEVALIRPGPIQGGSVHPYIRRANGEEEVTFDHPLLRPALEKTLGVPLFQEQLMQLAIDVADFTPAEADQLRRAMGSKRSPERMTELRERLFTGMAAHGITGQVAETVYDKLVAFANYGFPESHAYSFAYLVYASAFLKCYYPAAMCAALLRAQPMGFYSPQSLVADARRHDVEVLGVDVNASCARTDLAFPDPHAPYVLADARGRQARGDLARRGPAVRLGLDQVRGIGSDLADRIAAARGGDAFRSISDLAQRVELTSGQLDALAAAGAFDGLVSRSQPPERARRAAMWEAGAAARESPATLPGVVVGTAAPTLPGMSDTELAAAGVWATGIETDAYPIEHARPELDGSGVLTIEEVRTVAGGRRIHVAGIVTHRQRPSTAQGTTFLGLEDETGLLNVVCSVGFWQRHRVTLRTSPAVVLRGRVENADGVVNLLADGVEPLPLGIGAVSRDFR